MQSRSEPLAPFKLPQFLQQNICLDLKGVIQLLLRLIINVALVIIN